MQLQKYALAIFELQLTGNTDMYLEAAVRLAAKQSSEKSLSWFENFKSENVSGVIVKSFKNL
jgi:hypothetical protein